MPQILDITTNENVCYTHNELEYNFDLQPSTHKIKSLGIYDSLT